MSSTLPARAASGSPPPITLPNVQRSGWTPKSGAAPERATRKPVITSSKIKSVPAASQADRNRVRYSGSGSTRPMFAATGSTMTQATSSPSSGTTP